MERQRDHLLNRILELDAERQKVMLDFQNEKAALITAVFNKDDQIEADKKLIESQKQALAAKEAELAAALPEVVTVEPEVDPGMSHLIEQALAESGILFDDIPVYELTEPDIEFIFE